MRYNDDDESGFLLNARKLRKELTDLERFERMRSCAENVRGESSPKPKRPADEESDTVDTLLHNALLTNTMI